VSEARLESAEQGLRLVGELTQETVPSLWANSLKRFKAGQGGCRVDLSGVTRTDSAGVALLLEWMRLCGGPRGGLRFVSVPERMWDLIRLSDLDGVMPLERDD
jgi:phospholipid transport system transporter-binding protein